MFLFLLACTQEITTDDTSVDTSDDTSVTTVSPVHVTPEPYELALRNPLKGFTTNGIYEHEWATLSHVYIRWNELENDESDGLDKIVSVIDEKFSGVEENNVKVIPRVYLHWSGEDQKYWPMDMTTDDYSSAQFQSRLERLVQRLGTVWNDDPRVAFIEMGIFGKWGEHHSPSPDSEMQTFAANLFSSAFPDKQVSVRHAWSEFTEQPFGEYWDSFAHYDQHWVHGASVRTMNEETGRYLNNYIGGETAYNWGNWELQPGSDPTDSVSDPIHRDFVVNTIKWLHGTQLRWIDGYDQQDPAAREGAEEIQRALGYRFVLDDVGFTPLVQDGYLDVTMTVRNEGSAPFYYDWPLEVSLLDIESREVEWSATFQSVDVRSWTGGSQWTDPDWTETDTWSVYYPDLNWSPLDPAWGQAPPQHYVEERFELDVPIGSYILALSVLDPAGMLPSLRFATGNYFNGGRHPIGIVALEEGSGGLLPDDIVFDDPLLDRSLYYRL